MTKLIPLADGRSAIVDDEDFEWLSQWKWHTSNSGSRGYAMRQADNPYETIAMHRTILNVDSPEVDHINLNKLDNRRSNLRPATYTQNRCNQDKKSGVFSSQYKGVSWCKKMNRWRAEVKINKKRVYSEYFFFEPDAAHAYDTAASIHHGEFARLNFPGDDGYCIYPKAPAITRTSQYRGVSSARVGWCVSIMVNQKNIYIGQFASEIEAARAYDAKSLEIHGEFAYLNFPQEQP